MDEPVGVLKNSPIPDDAHKNLLGLKLRRIGVHAGHEIAMQRQLVGAMDASRRRNMQFIMTSNAVSRLTRQERKLWRISYVSAGMVLAIVLIKTWYWLMSFQ